MHIHFSGIGGAGIGPLALIAHEAGYQVSGSDKQDSSYLQALRQKGINEIRIGEDAADLHQLHAERPIDWLVYSSALPLENPNHPHLRFCQEQQIKYTKRDVFLSKLLEQTGQKMIAIAGTHGKTTTTAMTVWLLKSLSIPCSYVLPAKTSFADLGSYDPSAAYFVYEADEFDRNFLAYHPAVTMITGIDWDHPDIYPTKNSYNDAFLQFFSQSKHTYIWQADAQYVGAGHTESVTILDPTTTKTPELIGQVNRYNAALVCAAMSEQLGLDQAACIGIMKDFPGAGRRFEKIAEHVYTDYAHTPPKIAGALQIGAEHAAKNLVVIYEGLHNTRQHFIRDELRTIFDGVKQLYVVPSYLAREDASLALLSPDDLIAGMSDATRAHASPAGLDEALLASIKRHQASGDTVLCISAGGGGSLDEWLRARLG